MEIYILRDNHEFGPYSREAALEYIKQGIFEALDQACYAGMTEWKPVGELLGLDADSKPGRGPARANAGKIAEFNPTWVHSNTVGRRRPRRRGIKTGLMILLNLVLLSFLATAAYVRWGGGSRVVRHCLAALSVELARLADAGSENNATPAPAAPAPVTAKAPPAPAEASPPPAAGSTPALPAVAAPSPGTAAVATSSPHPAPVANAADSPASAATPSASAPASLVAANAQPSPALAPAPSPAAEVAAAAAPASTPEAAASPLPGSADANTSAPAPVAAPAAPAQPKPFNPADLAGNPGAWPKTLLLKQPVIFPLLDGNSQVVGSVTEPAGSAVKLVNIQGDQLTLEYNGLRQTTSWKQTDLEEEAAKSAAQAPPVPPASAAPAAAPAPSAAAPGATEPPGAVPQAESAPPTTSTPPSGN
jgi:hypothetical protein